MDFFLVFRYFIINEISESNNKKTTRTHITTISVRVYVTFI